MGNCTNQKNSGPTFRSDQKSYYFNQYQCCSLLLQRLSAFYREKQNVLLKTWEIAPIRRIQDRPSDLTKKVTTSISINAAHYYFNVYQPFTVKSRMYFSKHGKLHQSEEFRTDLQI